MDILSKIIGSLEKLEKALTSMPKISTGMSASLPKPVAPKVQKVDTPQINQPKAPKAPSLTPQSKKNPIKVAEQSKDKLNKPIEMKQAKIKFNAMRNQSSIDAFKKSEDNDLFYVVDRDGDRVMSEPHTKKYIMANVENPEHMTFIPIKQERIVTKADGTWDFEMSEEDFK